MTTITASPPSPKKKEKETSRLYMCKNLLTCAVAQLLLVLVSFSSAQHLAVSTILCFLFSFFWILYESRTVCVSVKNGDPIVNFYWVSIVGWYEREGGLLRWVWEVEEAERNMRTLCDVCESAAAIVFCAADEAALCSSCDEKVFIFLISIKVIISHSPPPPAKFKAANSKLPP